MTDSEGKGDNHGPAEPDLLQTLAADFPTLEEEAGRGIKVAVEVSAIKTKTDLLNEIHGLQEGGSKPLTPDEYREWLNKTRDLYTQWYRGSDLRASLAAGTSKSPWGCAVRSPRLPRLPRAPGGSGSLRRWSPLRLRQVCSCGGGTPAVPIVEGASRLTSDGEVKANSGRLETEDRFRDSRIRELFIVP